MERFNGRPAPLAVPLAGPALWLVACQVPVFYESAEARLILGSILSAGYYLAAAVEVFRRDGLMTRYAMAVVLAFQGSLLLVRVPITLAAPTDGSAFATPWFGPAALEAAIFIQVVAFLMVSLIKERVEAQLRSAALTDPLTGLQNRRYFDDALAQYMEEFSRIERPMGIMIVDIDHFKSINDTYGHDVGDEVIKGLANTVREYTRYHDIAARIGGEEFAIVAPNVDVNSLDKLANRLRLAVSDLVFNVGNVRLRITISIGIAIWDGKESGAALYKRADTNLYNAKRNGRNRVCA